MLEYEQATSVLIPPAVIDRQVYWERLSTFIFEWVWEHQADVYPCSLFAHDQQLTADDFAFLRATFTQTTPTPAEPTFHGFQAAQGEILIWPKGSEHPNGGCETLHNPILSRSHSKYGAVEHFIERCKSRLPMKIVQNVRGTHSI